jgi:hypothetical protein
MSAHRWSAPRAMAIAIAALASGLPAAVAAQCRIDVIESGVRAYRDLQLDEARRLLRRAIDENGTDPSSCATENARALTYLGATHRLRAAPDSAARAFRDAVIQAPLFRPDELEFPPDVTTAYDSIRRSTPAVALSVPALAVIGPRDAAEMPIHLVASVDHSLSVTVRRGSGEPIRTLHRGQIQAGAGGLEVRWDGRDSEGRAVTSGAYELEVVSAEGWSRSVRKVTVALDVDSDAPERTAPAPVVPRPSAPTPVASSTWKGVASAGAGLLAGALVIALPTSVSGFPETDARYVVGASVGVAGIVGLVHQLTRRERAPSAPRTAPVATPAPTPQSPTLTVRTGQQQRTELADEGATRREGSPSPRR